VYLLSLLTTHTLLSVDWQLRMIDSKSIQFSAIISSHLTQEMADVLWKTESDGIIHCRVLHLSDAFAVHEDKTSMYFRLHVKTIFRNCESCELLIINLKRPQIFRCIYF